MKIIGKYLNPTKKIQGYLSPRTLIFNLSLILLLDLTGGRFHPVNPGDTRYSCVTVFAEYSLSGRVRRPNHAAIDVPNFR